MCIQELQLGLDYNVSNKENFYFLGEAFPLCHFADCFCLKRLNFLLQVFSV